MLSFTFHQGDAFTNVPKLTLIDLNDAEVSDIDIIGLAPLSNLRTLLLSNNK